MTQDSPHEPRSLAILAHELRTPLNAVLGYADAMRSEVFGPLPAPYREQASVIHAAAVRLLALVDLMTAPGGAGTGERPLAMEPLAAADIKTLLSDAVSLLAPRAAAFDLELRTALAAPAAIHLRADRVALGRILINLIDNAVKFTAPGGAVAITAEAASGEVVLTVENGGGAGAPSGAAGAGLGLGLVRDLVRAMGGTFDLDFPTAGRARAVVRLPSTAKT